MDQTIVNDLKLENSVFRSRIRLKKIPKLYWGPGHLLFNASLLFSTLIYYSTKIKLPTYLELSPYLLIILIGNLAVYFIHKYPLHGRYWWNSYAYSNHTKTHHVFYTQNNITLKSSKDWYTMFFPPEIALAFVLLLHPLFYFILKPFIGLNATYAFMSATSMYFILYEIVHFCSHLPSDHFMMKFSLLRLMRRHHQLHHDPKLMGKYNFCIVFPLFDILMGTYITDKEYTEHTGREVPGSGDTNA